MINQIIDGKYGFCYSNFGGGYLSG